MNWLLNKTNKIPSNELLTYESVSFTHANKNYQFTREEIQMKLCNGCTNCDRLNRRIKALEAQLTPSNEPDMHLEKTNAKKEIL